MIAGNTGRRGEQPGPARVFPQLSGGIPPWRCWHAPPGRAGAVAAVNPAFGMTGYALGPTLYILLINVYFQQEWLANAQATGLSVKRAQHAVNGPGVRAGACVRSWIGA